MRLSCKFYSPHQNRTEPHTLFQVFFYRDGGSSLGGPSADHTLQTDVGNYILMEATGSENEAILVSQPLEGNVSYCLTFYTVMPADAEVGLRYHNLVNEELEDFISFSGTGNGWDQVILNAVVIRTNLNCFRTRLHYFTISHSIFT